MRGNRETCSVVVNNLWLMMSAKRDTLLVIWPNRETTISKKKTFKSKFKTFKFNERSYRVGELIQRIGIAACLEYSGLVRLMFGPGLISPKKFRQTSSTRKRTGVDGITSYGRRQLKNGAALVERIAGRSQTTFATCTLPGLPAEDILKLGQNWNKVIDSYKRSMTRLLIKRGLTPNIVIASEIQPKRSEREGIPVLHIHAVFQGRKKGRPWAISTDEHDAVWQNAISAVVGYPVPCPRACNMQQVRKSASGYLGKYLSKGVGSTEKWKELGLQDYLPKQWWSMTRSLKTLIDKNKIYRSVSFGEVAHCLAGELENDNWKWFRDFELEWQGRNIRMSRYGELTEDAAFALGWRPVVST